MNQLLKDFDLIINSAINSVLPFKIFKEKVFIDKQKISFQNHSFQLDQFEKIFVIGFGKASSAMATEIEKYLYDRIDGGIVITKYGFKTPTEKIEVFEAGHPLPDENTLKYSKEILHLLQKTRDTDLVICLISGGGSSLFEIPIDGIDLETLQLVNDFLIKQKIPIHEINFIRKAISKVKGGKLLNYIFPSTCISLIISDVIGDDHSVIASGTTCFSSEETFIDKDDISDIKKSLYERNTLHKIEQLIKFKSIPDEISRYYNSKVHNFIVASNKTALEKSVEISNQLGYEIHSYKCDVSSSVEILTKNFFSDFLTLNQIQKPFKRIIVYGGETFLEVKGKGKGGRNLHLILLILNELIKNKIEPDFKFIISSIATDGNDGNTDVAGAFINNELIDKAKSSSYSTEFYLQNFDSYHLFKKLNCLIKTGPTLTNVADLFICLACSE